MMVKIQPYVDTLHNTLTLSFEARGTIETVSVSISNFLTDMAADGISVRICGRRTTAQVLLPPILILLFFCYFDFII